MAYRRGTIVKKMVEASGIDPETISTSIIKDKGYVQRVIEGKEHHVSTNTLALIADRCGYKVMMVGHDESLQLAHVDRPHETRDFDEMDPVDCKYTGCEIAITGALYGFTSDAQKALLRAVGATWIEHVRVKYSDYLIRGSDFEPDGETTQIRRVLNARNPKTKIINAEDFRRDFLAITGVDLKGLEDA